MLSLGIGLLVNSVPFILLSVDYMLISDSNLLLFPLLHHLSR